jgi:hypothetical protein
MPTNLAAGAAAVEITPQDTQFLFGYPHVERYSTGVHDPLISSALCLSNGEKQVMFVANDIVSLEKDTVHRVREAIEQESGVPGSSIMLTATHTHSGPKTGDYVSHSGDEVVPKADPGYVAYLEERIIRVGVQAAQNLKPAQLGLATADGTGVGTNRRDPSGPSDPEVPVMMVRGTDGQDIACMLVYSMHPTVLHEDSTLISADFPGMTRRYLQQQVLGEDCPVLYHTGPAGNQSPRHVTRANTFAEAIRLGNLLGESVARAVSEVEYVSDLRLESQHEYLDLPAKTFPSLAVAEDKLRQAVNKLDHLRRSGAPRQEVRTAECDWFGAEELVTFSLAQEDGRLAEELKSCLPAEVHLLKVGRWGFIGWPGEAFVEYSLAVKATHSDTYVIELANGKLGGYVVTPEAAAEGGYEASNGIFKPEAGQMFVDASRRLLDKID